MFFIIYIIVKIAVFLSFNNKNKDKSIKKTDISLYKSNINSKSIKAKIYIFKIFKTFFCKIFLRLSDFIICIE